MPRDESPQLNETYQKYKDNPTAENYEEFGTGLMSYAEAVIRRTCGSRFREIEDVVSEACLEVLKDLPSFNPEKSSFKTWAYEVVYRTCQDKLRKARYEAGEELPLDAGMSESYDLYAHLDAKIELEKRIAKLSKQEQDLVEMKMFGFSNEEIAAELDTTVDAIKGQWKRIMPKLRTLGGGN